MVIAAPLPRSAIVAVVAIVVSIATPAAIMIAVPVPIPITVTIAVVMPVAAVMVIIIVIAGQGESAGGDRKSTRLNSSHEWILYAVFCLKKKKDEMRLRGVVAIFLLHSFVGTAISDAAVLSAREQDHQRVVLYALSTIR